MHAWKRSGTGIATMGRTPHGIEKAMKSQANRAFLDTPWARVAALGCFLLCAAALAYLHRDDLFPATPETPVAADDPFARCVADSTAKIDAMRKEGTIGDDQAQLFRLRAEARCRAQSGDGGPPPRPPLPGQ